MKAKTLVMDRKESGLVDFSKDFPIATAAPLNLCKGETYHLNILVDMNSVEIFLDGGRIAMTNLIFPTKPYSHLSFQAGTFSNVLISPLGL